MKPPTSLAPSGAALVIPGLLATVDRGRCLDGVLRLSDIAKAAGVPAKEVKRRIEQYLGERKPAGESGVSLTLEDEGDTVTDPATQTRAQMARIVAEKLGLGRFGIRKKIEERAASRPPRRPKEKPMGTERHPWKLGTHGRAVRGAEGGGVAATLSCGRCDTTETIRFRQLAGSDDMDRKFRQRGWDTDPARCPEHNSRKGTGQMGSVSTMKPSPAAIASQGKMLRLLLEHFDAEKGLYGPGWSDKKVAEECGFSPEHVAAIRDEAIGPLQEPPEIAALTADIEALTALVFELETSVGSAKSELDRLKARHADLRRRFTA